MPTVFKLWQHGLLSIYWCTFSNQQSFCQVLLIECLKHIFTCMEMGAKHAWNHTFYLYHGTSALWHKPLSWHVDQQINIHYATAKKNMQTISSYYIWVILLTYIFLNLLQLFGVYPETIKGLQLNLQRKFVLPVVFNVLLPMEGTLNLRLILVERHTKKIS